MDENKAGLVEKQGPLHGNKKAKRDMNCA